LALAVSGTLAGRAAQHVTASPAVVPNSTSLNGSGNIFLTASLIANPGAGNGSAVSVAVADFNGDTKQDIAVVSAGCTSCGVTILRGNGDGTFQAPLSTANLGGPYYVTAGDFNGDGRQDLAVIGYVPTNLTTPAVFILLGNGDGTFTLKTTLTGFTTPNAIALGDFNGDGKLDLAVSESQPGAGTPSSVLVFLGNGDGTVQAPVSTTVTGVGNATYMATADFNKDNHLDLVLADTTTSHVVVLLGNGNGNFQAARSFPIAYAGFDVAVGDFNGDGIPDIAATTTAANTVDILLGKGDGNFQAAVSYSAGQLGGGTTNLAVGDFNKDGKLDVITSISGAYGLGSSVSVMLGKGDGTFLPPSLVTVNQLSGQLAVADFDGDGNPDWIAAKTNGTLMTLALGNGDGTFRAGMNYALGGAPDVTLADVNKDGKLDVIAVDPGSNDVRVLLGKGDGTFQPAVITALTQPTYGIVVGDFNGDGNPDVVVGDAAGVSPRNVIVLLGKGDGTFAAPTTFTTGGSGEGLILTADFNGDGKLDIAVVNESDNTVSILLGNGDGTFQAPKITPALATDGFLGAMAAADLNGDGKLDLVVPDWVSAAAGQVAILLGKGDGTFQAPTFLTSSGGSTWPVIADFNKDGKLDLAVANQFGTIDVFLGNGDGSFNTPLVLNDVQTNVGNPIPISLVVGDFNLDGNLDLLVGPNSSDIQANPFTNVNVGLQLFLGNGDGTFQVPQNYLAGAQSNPVLVGDFNGDGAPDVAAGDTGENIVSILLNQTPPPVVVTPKSLPFGNQLVGTTSASQPLMVTNNGSTTATISIGVSGTFGETNNCGGSLGSKASCTINVTFTPTGMGVSNGDITLTDNLPGSPQIIPLSGTGVAPIVMLGANSLGFGNQDVGTTSAPKMVSLSNTGTAALTISSIAITGANAGDFAQTNTCGGSVGVGANCSISVTFKPAAVGNRTATVMITDDGAGSPQSVTLTGTGVEPIVMLSTTSLPFAGQLITTPSAAQGVTLTNNGTAPLIISSIAISGANSGDFAENNNCPASTSSLAAGAKCTINVTFTPTATGNRATNIAITDDAADSPQAVALSGTGTDFTIDVAAGGSNSATVNAGQPAAYSLQVTPVSGFNGTVTLGCAGAPSEAVCTTSTSTATPNGNMAAPFSANVTTRAPSLFVPHGVPPRVPPLTWIRMILRWMLAFMAVVLLSRINSVTRYRRWAFVPAAALLLGVLGWIGGCGSGGGGGGHDPGTPSGAYTLTVTGTSNNVNRALKLTLKVN